MIRDILETSLLLGISASSFGLLVMLIWELVAFRVESVFCSCY